MTAKTPAEREAWNAYILKSALQYLEPQPERRAA